MSRLSTTYTYIIRGERGKHHYLLKVVMQESGYPRASTQQGSADCTDQAKNIKAQLSLKIYPENQATLVNKCSPLHPFSNCPTPPSFEIFLRPLPEIQNAFIFSCFYFLFFLPSAAFPPLPFSPASKCHTLRKWDSVAAFFSAFSPSLPAHCSTVRGTPCQFLQFAVGEIGHSCQRR